MLILNQVRLIFTVDGIDSEQTPNAVVLNADQAKLADPEECARLVLMSDVPESIDMATQFASSHYTQAGIYTVSVKAVNTLGLPMAGVDVYPTWANVFGTMPDVYKLVCSNNLSTAEGDALNQVYNSSMDFTAVSCIA